MKLFFRLLLLLSTQLILLNFLLGQQHSSNKKAQEAYRKAEIALNSKNKTEAIQQLQTAIQNDANFTLAYQQLADLFRSEKRYQKAIPLYEKVITLNPNLTKLTYFGLGESLLNEGRYNDALPYLTYYSQQKITEKGLLLTNKYIVDCNFALKQNYNNTVDFQKLSKEINTQDNEYFPKLTADNRKIIFTRKTNNQENFYESYFDSQKWSEATILTQTINSKDFNEGAHCISPDGKNLYFTGCNRPDELGSCDIYISKLVNNEWSSPQNLGVTINSKNWESQPAISADGRTLYFVSNRAGGYGGYDIWKSDLSDNDTWSPPINLGNNINTIFDEGSPYIHADNTSLYFASNGWPGFGQQDLYLSKKDSNNIWSIPINLGFPINDHYAQNSIQITLDGNIGFTSSQDSSRQLDIYQFVIPNEIKPKSMVYISGTIYDEKTYLPLKAFITITNTSSNKIIYKDLSDAIDGTFLATLPPEANYALHIQKKGYLFYSEQYDLSSTSIKDKKFIRKILLQPIEKEKHIHLNNLYFDTDKYDILPESYAELLILLDFLNINPYLRIEISGHTDNKGEATKNKTLSNNRANAVYNYLLQHGVKIDRMVKIGYGDTKPISDNDTEEGRQLNRRTDIKIIE